MGYVPAILRHKLIKPSVWVRIDADDEILKRDSVL
jgi:hypothetical protein